MKLIDADLLIKDLLEQIPLAENVPIFKEIIESQPTAYDVDNVIEQLREFDGICDSCKHKDECNECSVGERITIVKRGGKE